MKIKLTSREYAERLARERGIPIAPPDHPIYQEGPTLVFFSDSLKSDVESKPIEGAKIEDKKMK